MKHLLGLAFITVTITTTACDVPPPKPVLACPATYHEVGAADRTSDLTCSCAATTTTGTVWGSSIYTQDSSICNAARHAGALAATGAGNVTVRATKGCDAYTGTIANGVTSAAWGKFDASFVFAGKPGRCVGDPVPSVAAAAPAAAACPASWDLVANAATTPRLTCSCGAIPTSGSVWGVGTYTSDSSICRAAAHAGAVSAKGGTVTVVRAPGCATYKGSDANGIHAESWGNHAASFYFNGKGNGGCG